MMRRFTIEEEQALLRLLVDDMRWHKLPARPGASPYTRLARLGCLQTIQHGIVMRGRLTATGRYFAVLLREAGLVIADPPGMIGERTARRSTTLEAHRKCQQSGSQEQCPPMEWPLDASTFQKRQQGDRAKEVETNDR